MPLLTDLQDDLLGRLLSCPDMAHVSCLVLEGTSEAASEEIRTELNRVLTGVSMTNGKAGLGVLILLPRMRREPGMENVPGPQVHVACKIQVVENKAFNRDSRDGTGIKCADLAHTILSLFDQYQPRSGVCLTSDENVIDPAEVDDDLGADQAFEVNLIARLWVQPAPKVPAPTLDVEEGVLTITGAEGAAHWFTLDGSFPRPNTSTSQLYAAPVAVAAGTLIRAASYHPDFNGSDNMEHQA